MDITPAGPTLPGITHHRAEVSGTTLHYVAAGTSGSPVLLVHGFPETWWAFRKLIPLLAASHRVFAADLRGFGDSGHEPGEYDSVASAEDLAHTLLRSNAYMQNVSALAPAIARTSSFGPRPAGGGPA